MEFFVADECVGHIAECPLNGLAVRNQSLLVLRLGYPQIPSKGSARENGLAYLGAVGPDPKLRAHQAGESAAPPKRPAAGTRQGDLRKELCLGHSDFGVGGD